MSVIVKGMKIPKKCEQCWFFGTDSARVGYCYLLKGELPLPDGVPQDCPIIEVPTPHGRLIDADCCNGYFYEHMSDDMMIAAMNAINEMPTVIKSENE